MKDISDFLPFDEDGCLPKRSIKSVINMPAVVHGWKILESKYKDGNPSGKFVQMQYEVQGRTFIINTGSEIIMEQLAKIKAAKEEEDDESMDFTCVIKRCGRGVMMFPVKWIQADDCQEK